MATLKKGIFRRRVEQRNYALPTFTTTPPTWSEVSNETAVNIDDALSVPAVYRAVTIIATAVSQLSMSVERQGIAIDSALVARPDSNRSQSSFFKRTVHDLATAGNAYWRLYRNGDGLVVQMEALAPSLVTVHYDDNGNKLFNYKQFNGKEVTLTNNLPTTNNGQVEHIRLGEFDGHALGRGPIQANNRALYGVLELRAYTDRFMRESKRPSGIYSINATLDEAELAQAKKRVKENQVTGEPTVLDNNVKYETIMFTPEQAALIELNKAATLDVARMFGIPAHLLLASVDGNSMTYQNLLTADTVFVRYTLEQYLTSIEDAMTNVLPRGQVAQFDIDNWLRAAALTNEGSAPSANN